MTSRFIDYDGPTGPYVATEKGILRLSDPGGMAAVMDSAMLVSLGYSEKAAEYERLIRDQLETRPLFGGASGLCMSSASAAPERNHGQWTSTNGAYSLRAGSPKDDAGAR